MTDISLNNGATVVGRLLARNGQISLINNVLSLGGCAANGGSGGGTTPGAGRPGTGPGAAGGPGAPGTGNGAGTAPSAPTAAALQRRGTAVLGRTPRRGCAEGFVASVRGHIIRRVVFTLDGRRLASSGRVPLFRAQVRASPGRHRVRARVTFKDATPAKTLSFAYRACAAAARNPARGPSRFTG